MVWMEDRGILIMQMNLDEVEMFHVVVIIAQGEKQNQFSLTALSTIPFCLINP